MGVLKGFKMKTVPSLEDCNKIVDKSSVFYKKEEVVNGAKVIMFNYLLAEPKDFKEHNAYELRGITYVQDDFGLHCYPALNKFFNLNQTEGWNFDDVKNKKIKSSYEKEDGSMVQFIKINGDFFAKTKMSFNNEQTSFANDIFRKDVELQKLVHELDEQGLTGIFEFVSPFNKIVLTYPESKLVLLRVRDKKTGEYINIDKFNYNKPKNYTNEIKSLDEYMKLQDELQDIEGWVIEFDDGQLIKLKTKWYLKLHRLYTDEINSEKVILKYILEDEFDDVISQIPENDERRKWAEEINSAVIKYIDKEVQRIYNYLNSEELKSKSRKDISIENKDDQYFSVIMYSLRDVSYTNIKNNLIKFISKKTGNLTNSQKFIENINPELLLSSKSV